MKFLIVLAAALVCTATAAAVTPTTMRLTEKQTFEHFVDKGAKGESPGDVRTFGGPVFKGTTRIGHDRIRCVVGGKCDATVWLPKGILRSHGFVATGPRFTVPVTGGTGVYKGAQGTVRVSAGRITTYVIRLTR